MADQEDDKTRRITIELPADVLQKLDANLDWGMKKLLYITLSRMVVDVLEKHGKHGAFLVISGLMDLHVNQDKMREMLQAGSEE